MRKAVSVEEGVERLLLSLGGKRQTEYVPLAEAAGRILAQDLRSRFPIPSFRKAAMDGYAVRSALLEQAAPQRPTLLPVTAEIRSGASGLPQGNHAAVRIFTGAPVPEPFDAVVVQEAVRALEEERPHVRFPFPAERGMHIAEIGEDIREDALVLERGTPLRAKEIALAATFGLGEVEVYRQPAVAVIPIGDELLLPGEALPPYRLYDSNGYMLEARLREIGARCIRHAPVSDDPHVIGSKIAEALRDADIVVTSGGVSVGTYDYVPRVMEDMPSETLFTKVLMRPGSPTSAFAVNGRTTIHLSGNPSACLAGFELLVKPAVMYVAGRKHCRNETVEAVLADDVGRPCPYPRYIRSLARVSRGTLYVTPLPQDRSGNIAAFAQANALTMIPAGGGGAAKGQTVMMQWL